MPLKWALMVKPPECYCQPASDNAPLAAGLLIGKHRLTVVFNAGGFTVKNFAA